MSGLTVVYYFCPEDGEDLSQPSAFGLQKPLAAVEFKDIIDNFPLRGEYVFRAKFKQGKEVLWLDMDKSAAKVPSEDGAIWLKVKRVGWGKPVPKQTVLIEEDDEIELSHHTSNKANMGGSKAQTPGQHAHGGHKPASQPLFNFEGANPGYGMHGHHHAHAASQSPQKQATAKPKTDMIDLDIDLSGMGTPSSHQAASKQTLNLMEDFLL